MPIAIYGVQADVTMLNRAFNDISPAHLVYTNQVNAASGGEAAITAFAIQFGNSFSSVSDTALATRVLANMGLLPNIDLLIGVADYFAANPGARGLVVLQIARILTQQESATGFMAQFVKAAVAWNDEVMYSFIASERVSNTVPGLGDPLEEIAAAAAGKLAANALAQATLATVAATDAANTLRSATVRTGEALTDASLKVTAAKSAIVDAVHAADAFASAAAATLTTTLDDNLAVKTRADASALQPIVQEAAALLQALAPGFFLGQTQQPAAVRQVPAWESESAEVLATDLVLAGVSDWAAADLLQN